MPLFNFRRAGSSSAASAASANQPDSAEVVRKRAKHRLIGSAVLVLAGVIGFPLLFDTQPRPISVDIPIEIPAKNAVKPLVLPAAKPEAARPAASAETAAAPAPAPASAAVKPDAAPAADKVTAAASLASKEEILTEKKAAAPVIPAQPATKKEVPETKKETASTDHGARARALLEGQDNAAPAAAASGSPASVDGRVVVQVGAFADAGKAREARVKLEKAGLKTYTQVADTASGKRTRVRVGPFSSRAEAEKAASKIRSLDLPAAILTL